MTYVFCAKCGKEINYQDKWEKSETGNIFCTECTGNEPVAHNEIPSERWFWYEKICEKCLELAKEKNKLYGNLAIKELGEKGIFVRVWDKVNRLKSIVWDGKEDTQDERLKDTLMDLINYAVFMLLLQEGKW